MSGGSNSPSAGQGAMLACLLMLLRLHKLSCCLSVMKSEHPCSVSPAR